MLFFGNLSERRREMLDRLASGGIAVHVVDVDSWVFGADLDRLVAGARIVLVIHQYDEPTAQVADLGRVDVPLANGRFVLHEAPAAVAADPDFSAHVPTCSYDDIPEACRYFLDHPDERDGRARAAREWFCTERVLDAVVPYEDVARLLERPDRTGIRHEP